MFSLNAFDYVDFRYIIALPPPFVKSFLRIYSDEVICVYPTVGAGVPDRPLNSVSVCSMIYYGDEFGTTETEEKSVGELRLQHKRSLFYNHLHP